MPAFGWVGLAVGATGLAVGGIAGAVSLVQTGNIKSACDASNACPGQSGAISSATVSANVSNVGFGFAAAGAVLFGVGLAVSGSSSKDEGSAELVPAGSGVALRVRF